MKQSSLAKNCAGDVRDKICIPRVYWRPEVSAEVSEKAVKLAIDLATVVGKVSGLQQGSRIACPFLRAPV